MTPRLSRILDTVLQDEGGLVHHPKDPGGITNFGITIPWLTDLLGRPVSPDEIRRLTRDQAKHYYHMWTTRRRISDVIDISAKVGEILIDFSVHSGHVNPARALQRALGTTADGRIGPETLRCLALADPDDIATEVLASRLELWSRIVRGSHPFIEGWLLRVARQLRRVWTAEPAPDERP